VVGYSSTAGGVEDAFLYHGGTMTDLGGLATDSQGNSRGSEATAINDSGQIVGYAQVTTAGGDGTEHAFIYSNGVMTDLGAGDGSTALGINNAGQVIGVWASGYYVESNGVFTNLSALPAGINDKGDIVGYAQTADGQSNPYLYTEGQTTALSSLLPANSGWTLTNAMAINNSDQIVGTGMYQGKQQAYLLTLNAAKASPTLVTTASPATVTLDGSGSSALTDSAVLSGGSGPTGTITFTLTGPSGHTVDTESVTVDGDGTYTSPTGYKLPTSGTVAGTYVWSAVYSGDSNNSTTSDNGANEKTVVRVTPPTTIGEQAILERKTNKKGKPVGKLVLQGFTLEFSQPMGALAGDAAEYILESIVSKATKHKPAKVKPVGFTVVYTPSRNTVAVNIAGNQPFMNGGLLTVSDSIASADGATLSGTNTFTIGKGGKTIVPE
jgi:probable HAF family extracellular repeat protein